jgi:hypothetical protein
MTKKLKIQNRLEYFFIKIVLYFNLMHESNPSEVGFVMDRSRSNDQSRA